VSGEAILSAENSEKSLGGQSFASNPTGELTALPDQWCGLRTSVLGQNRSETKKSVLVLVLVLQVLCCVVKYNLVTLVVIMILEDTAAFQVLVKFLYFVLGTSLLWRSTVAFTYL